MPQLCQVFFLWTIEWLSDYCLTLSEQFLSYIMAGTSYIPIKWWWCLLFNRPTLPKLDFYSGSSLKHKSTVRSVTPLGHIIHDACYSEKQQIPIL
jgi:hypothetical protein